MQRYDQWPRVDDCAMEPDEPAASHAKGGIALLLTV
jgi:hypothetical protein